MATGLHNAYSEIDGGLPNRQAARFRPVVRACEHCGGDFVIEARQARRQGRGRFCSRSCQSGATAGKRLLSVGQRGALNPNWKGGVSAFPSRYTKRFKAKFPEKARASRLLREAVYAGRVVRPTACEACGATCKPHGHHDNYRKPLSVRWLCQLCHIAHHVALRQGKAA